MKVNDVLIQAQSSIMWMYDKKLDVYEAREIIKDNGADGIEFQKAHADIPCRLSVQSLKNTQQTEARLLETEHKVFCQPDIYIKAGSKITVDGVKYLTSEDPMIYITHQELVVKRHEWV